MSITPTNPPGAPPKQQYSEDVQNMSQGFLDVTIPSAALEQSMEDLMRLQGEFLALLAQEAKSFDENTIQALRPAIEVYSKAPHYEQKVQRMVRQMQSIDARVNKLKSRAANIQMQAHLAVKQQKDRK